jgi:arylsulfatase
MADLWCNDYFNGRFRHNGVLHEYPGYCTDVWFDLGMSWIRDRAKADEPFFLYLPTNAPHGPLWVADKYRQPYLDQGLKKPLASFFGMIANIDENVGKLDRLLEETGLRDNTILIYFHDNGGTAGVNFYNAGMRGRKTTYYEGGHRAACFVRWPGGNLRSPGDVDELCEVQDLLPTLTEFCDLGAPKSAGDGVSLASLLNGKRERLADRKLVVQYGQKPEKWQSAVLWKKWRLVHGTELYDLRSDPGQEKEVAAAHPDVMKQLREHYESWWSGVEPLLDDFVPIVLGSERENPVTLSAADWANVYCDNMHDLRLGKQANSVWHVQVARSGRYRISLRRWPKEADAAIVAGVPVFHAVDGELPEGKALPITKARLKIGDVFDQSAPVGAKNKSIWFDVDLQAGPKTTMQTWFYDAAGNELCGAYFTYVERVNAR